MLDWIARHSDLLSLLVNVGMLAVWLTYLHVFLVGYRRQVRPKIIINRGGGAGLNARCFVSNMGGEPIYIEDILVTIEMGQERWRASIIDVDGLDEDVALSDPKRLTHQGPLQSGGYMEIGRYGDILQHALNQNAAGDLRALGKEVADIFAKIEVIADHAADDLLIAARRRFTLGCSEDEWSLSPQTAGTEQVRSRAERRSLERTLIDEGRL